MRRVYCRDNLACALRMLGGGGKGREQHIQLLRFRGLSSQLLVQGDFVWESRRQIRRISITFLMSHSSSQPVGLPLFHFGGHPRQLCVRSRERLSPEWSRGWHRVPLEPIASSYHVDHSRRSQSVAAIKALLRYFPPRIQSNPRFVSLHSP